jgi:hypothetical protein
MRLAFTDPGEKGAVSAAEVKFDRAVAGEEIVPR